MDGPDGGHEGGRPEVAGHAMQDEEQQDGCGGMEHDADQMVSPRGLAEQLAVGGMGEPCQRMPIAGISGGKGPRNGSGGQPVADRRIAQDIFDIVVVDEFMAKRLAENAGDRQHKQTAYGPFFSHDIGSLAISFPLRQG